MIAYVAYTGNIELDDDPTQIVAVALTFDGAKAALDKQIADDEADIDDDDGYNSIKVPGDTVQDASGLVTYGIVAKEMLP